MIISSIAPTARACTHSNFSLTSVRSHPTLDSFSEAASIYMLFINLFLSTFADSVRFSLSLSLSLSLVSHIPSLTHSHSNTRRTVSHPFIPSLIHVQSCTAAASITTNPEEQHFVLTELIPYLKRRFHRRIEHSEAFFAQQCLQFYHELHQLNRPYLTRPVHLHVDRSKPMGTAKTVRRGPLLLIINEWRRAEFPHSQPWTKNYQQSPEWAALLVEMQFDYNTRYYDAVEVRFGSVKFTSSIYIHDRLIISFPCYR